MIITVKKRLLREAIVPAVGSTAKIGSDYNGALISFIQTTWMAKKASKLSPSLNSALKAIEKFKPVYGKNKC